MKNLHILPTDKLSKLYKVKEKFYIEEYPVTTVNAGNQNIYITNSEVIKEGEIGYIIDKQNNIRKVERVQTKNIGTPSYYCNSHSCDSSVNNVCYSIPIEDCKKIILTTDEDLIKDCVQAIDDEFLNWFVKNPSYEKVEIEGHIYKGQDETEYKIIIPKEEPKHPKVFSENGNELFFDKEGNLIKEELKQDLEKDMFELEQELNIPSHLRWYNSKPKQEYVCYKCQNKTSNKFEICDKCNVGWKEPKQETLEEAVERLYLKECDTVITKHVDTLDTPEGQDQYTHDTAFIKGAKWQQERSYSKEEVLELLNNCRGENPINVNKWFEQFKKK